MFPFAAAFRGVFNLLREMLSLRLWIKGYIYPILVVLVIGVVAFALFYVF